jgi:glycine cleavage system transcriptional repressor
LEKVLLALAGPDSPGVVYTVSEELEKINCIISDMSQTTLRNQFSSLLIVKNKDGLPLEEIQAHVSAALEGHGFDMAVSVKSYQEGKAKVTEGEPFVITLDGAPADGIMLALSRIFWEGRINIDSFRLFDKHPASGEKEILMVYEVTVPLTVDTKALSRTLGSIAKTFNMSLSMQHRRIFEAIHRVSIA